MKKVLIIGAGFLQDFVIKKAKTMGYEVYAVDADPNAIGFKHADHYGVVNIVDEKACLEYARVNNVDGVLTAATDYGVLTAAYVARKMGLPGLRYNVAQLIKNKYQVRKCLYENHVDDTEQASRVDKADDLEEACKYAMDGSITHRAEIETFIIGKEYGAETLVVNGEAHVLGIMQKWMTSPPYYAELGHSIPTDLKPEVEEKARNCVEKAIKALGVDFGSVNMDMLITEDGKVYIIDIGARMGGNMIGPCIIPYGTGVDYMAAMIQNAVGDSVDLRVKDKTTVATRLLAFDGGVVKMLPDMKEVEKKYDVEIYHHLEEGMKVNEYHTNLDGCGYIVAKGETLKEAVDKAEIVLDYFKRVIFEE